MSDLICPCCGRVSMDGLSRTEETMLRNLAAAATPLSTDEVMKGAWIDRGSFGPLLIRLKRKLADRGYKVTNYNRGPRSVPEYRLEPVERK